MARPKKKTSLKDSKSSRQKLLEAALLLIRTQGYTATSVDALCKQAGISKGTFFHNFKSKEDLGIQAATYWNELTDQIFNSAPYQKVSDPAEKVLAYIDYRKELLQGDTPEFTCLLGTMVQEAYHTHPDLRDACFQSINNHAQDLVLDIQKAKEKYTPKAPWSAESLALHIQGVIQGAFIIVKASSDKKHVLQSLDHLKTYIHSLFFKPTTNKQT